MKKCIILMFCLLLVFSTGCSSGADENTEKGAEQYQISGEALDSRTESSDIEHTEKKAENILITYFSRWGNTKYPEDVDATTSASIVVDEGNYGTTEYVARLIQENVGGDLHLIQTQEPYPLDFDELRDLNHSEMADGYLPALVESNLNISQYDTVFIGYPVWATTVPQAVFSFLNEYDLSGKRVIPFCTHDGYGAGNSYSTIREASHAAESPEGLAVESQDVLTSENTVATWLENLTIERK